MSQKFIYQKLIDTLKDEQTAGTVPLREVVSALVDLEVKVSTEKYISGQLRDGLKYYAPGPFWTEVTQDTKAAQDLGKHAEWILRMTDPDAA